MLLYASQPLELRDDPNGTRAMRDNKLRDVDHLLYESTELFSRFCTFALSR